MSLEKINTSTAPAAIGPYSQGIIVDKLIFTSGQLPIDVETGELSTGSITEQATLVFENIKAILVSCGSSLEKIIKVNVYLDDMNDFGEMNKLYETYFTQKPARSTLEVARIPKDAKIEVDVIALR